MSLVVDSSITLAWYFEDEITEASDDVLRRVGTEAAVVPPIWQFEVENGLRTAVRRRRVTSDFRDKVLVRLAQLKIVTDPDGHEFTWSTSVRLSDRYDLTIYDAAYLELAQRRRLELATLDSALARAARAELVAVVGS